MALTTFGSIAASESIQQYQSILFQGNSLGASSITGGDIYFSLTGNITASVNGSTVQFSVGTAGGGGNQIAAGTQTANSTATVVFSNSNGITFGMSNSSIITASHNGITSQSNQNITWYATNNTTQNSSSVLNANSVLLRAEGNLSIGYSNGSIVFSGGTALPSPIVISAGTTSNSISNLVFSNSNGITFGLNGSTITASHNGITAINFSAGTTSNNAANIIFSNSNNITFGLNGSTISASIDPINIGVSNIGNTAGSTGTIGGGGINYIFAGAGNLGVSQSTNGKSATLSIYDNTTYVNQYVPYFPASTGSQTGGAFGASTGSIAVFPVSLIQNVAFNELRVLQTMSFVSSTVAGSQSISSLFGIYTNNNGVLSLISSNSFSVGISVSSVSATLSYPTGTGTNGYTYGTTTATGTAQAQSLFGTVGNKVAGLVFTNNISLSQGMYYFGLLQRQSTSSAAVGLSTALGGNIMAAMQNVAPIGVASTSLSNNTNYHMGWGVFTSTGSAGHSGTALLNAMTLTNFNFSNTVMPMVTFVST